MKLFKKLAVLCAALLTTAGLSMATACEFGSLGDLSVPSGSNESVESSQEDSQSSSSPSSSSTSEPDSSASEQPGGDEDDKPTQNFTYRIKVQNETSFGFKNINVRLMQGSTEVASTTTNTNGFADFYKSETLPLGKYTVELGNLPNGYALKYPDLAYETMPEENFEVRIVLVPTGLIMEKAPIGTSYNLGDVMHDFSVKTSDGKDFTLSEVLEEKEMVMINFWATWCGPCKSEFPAMNNAYIEYQDKVGIIAISTTDTMAQVIDFKAQNGLQFDMTSNSESGANVAGMFNTAGIPVSIMIDRYGVVTFYHIGSMTATQDFTSRFDRFLGEEYTPTVIAGAGSEEGDGSENVDLRVEPDCPNPNPADIQAALGGDTHFSYTWDTDDKYAWPWLVGENGQYIEPAFEYRDGNYSTLIVKVTAKGGNAFSFDYVLNTETDSDVLYVMVDGTPAYQLSGTGHPVGTPKTGTCNYFFPEYETEASEHTIHLLYLKDSSESMANECVKISNFKFIEDGSEQDGLIFRHAANIANVDTDGKLLDGATSYYKYYATPVYNEADGYYHVGTEDGPLLFANLMLSSRWSDTSLWLLAFNDYIVADGYNFHADIEDHAWAANQPIPGRMRTFGYAPVTEALKELLVFATMSEPVKRENAKFWTGAWHENEWLEMCVYWEHRGDTDPLEDPMKTITFHAAEEVFEGENTAEVLFAMTPRGFKYKFTPTRSGVFHIYSSSKVSQVLDENNNPMISENGKAVLTEAIDTECFLVASDGRTFLGNYTDVVGKTYTYSYIEYEIENGEIKKDDDGNPIKSSPKTATAWDYNFYFHYYMEEGQTYYLLMTTYLDQTCQYPFHIDYVGETYTYMENVAVGPYSFNEVSFETYLPDAKEYTYSDPANGGDGYYHLLNEDGSLGSIIYLDMTRATAFFPNNSLYEIALDALSQVERDKVDADGNVVKGPDGKPIKELVDKYAPEKRAFYINGVDYSETVMDYAMQALFNDGIYEGYLALDQNLFDLLAKICGIKYGGLSDDWQRLCYYEKTLDATNH